MSRIWETYSSLKLNGVRYSRLDLLSLVKAKLKDLNIPDWEKAIFHFISEWLDDKDYVLVKTSGSTGNPKNIQIEKARMIASAQTTNTFFGLDASRKALLCLSAEYIAGKMMLLRAFVGGFNLQYVEPKGETLLKINDGFDFTAVVPLQLEAVINANDFQKINRVKKMIVGGAAVRQDLIQRLEQVETEVWATYGMTETVTHIALQGLNGKHKTDYFQGLPNVDFQTDERDCLRINAPAVSRDAIQTNDSVELLNAHQFRFLGRVDFVINSGGIKLSPEILEQKLEMYIESAFAFSSKVDELLGEKLVLVIEGETYFEEVFSEFNDVIKTHLDRFEQPKEILFIQEFPKTRNGKFDRMRLKEIIA